MQSFYFAELKMDNLGIFGAVRGGKDAIQNDFDRVDRIYVDLANPLLEGLNDEFEKLYPGYLKENADDVDHEIPLYNRFIADKLQALIVDDLNEKGLSKILDFYVDRSDAAFKAHLKMKPDSCIYYGLPIEMSKLKDYIS